MAGVDAICQGLGPEVFVVVVRGAGAEFSIGLGSGRALGSFD